MFSEVHETLGQTKIRYSQAIKLVACRVAKGDIEAETAALEFIKENRIEDHNIETVAKCFEYADRNATRILNKII